MKRFVIKLGEILNEYIFKSYPKYEVGDLVDINSRHIPNYLMEYFQTHEIIHVHKHGYFFYEYRYDIQTKTYDNISHVNVSSHYTSEHDEYHIRPGKKLKRKKTIESILN